MEDIIVEEWPEMESPTMVLGLTGWMDGGHVSTGTVGYLRERLAARPFAEIDPMDFYMFHFPVSSIPISVYTQDGKTVVAPVNPMEFAAVFRPHTKIEHGVIEELIYPTNDFWCAEESSLVLFSGEEPHIRWGSYCDCIFSIADEMGVRDIYFVGSVASPIPHTREPRITASVADESLKESMEGLEVGFGEYEGPASITTCLAYHSTALELSMRTLVAEVPHYPFLDMPTYPPSILKVTSMLNDLLGLGLDLSDLEASAATAREKLNRLMEENESFRDLVEKLEEAYEYQETSADEQLLRRLIDSIDLEGDAGQTED